MEHDTTVKALDEGAAQAICICGWRSPVFGVDKNTGTMDALEQAANAADLHVWEADLS